MPTKKNKPVKGKDRGLKSDKSVRIKKKVVRPIEHFYSKTKLPELLFTLYPDGRVEASEWLDNHLWLKLTGTNGAGKNVERARLSRALYRLLEYHGRCNPKPQPEDAEFGPPEAPPFLEPDPRLLLNELADALGARVLGSSKALGKSVQYAVEGIQRWKSGKRKTLGRPNVIWMIHNEAKKIIRSEKRLPTKREIRQQLEADGIKPNGKTAWSDYFNTAGLGDLEEWNEQAWEASMRNFPHWEGSRGRVRELDLFKEFPERAEKLRMEAKKFKSLPNMEPIKPDAT